MHIEFYSTLATIIPIVFFTISVQSIDFINFKPSPLEYAWLDRVFARLKTLVLCILVLAEILSLAAIYNSSDTHYIVPYFHSAFICITLFFAVGLVIIEYFNKMYTKGGIRPKDAGSTLMPKTKKQALFVVSVILSSIIIGFILGFFGYDSNIPFF